MRRYLVFSGDRYYPGGGWRDFEKDCDTVEDALVVAATLECDWFQIVDNLTGKIVHDVFRT